MRYKMDIEKICNEVLDELNPCYDIEMSLKNSFITVIKYLNQFPENLSVRSKNNIPDVKTKEGIEQLAVSYFNGFHSPTVPKLPQTVPDEMVSFIMEIVFNHSKKERNGRNQNNTFGINGFRKCCWSTFGKIFRFCSKRKRFGLVLWKFCKSYRLYKI